MYDKVVKEFIETEDITQDLKYLGEKKDKFLMINYK